MFGSLPVSVTAVAVLKVAVTLCALAVGAWMTVRVAALLVALPWLLVKTARYWRPLSPAVVAGVV